MKTGWKIGIDIILVSRIGKSFSSRPSSFLKRFFNESERVHCEGPRRVETIAGRIAAKEAVMKVLGTGWPKIPWTDIEILTGENERPFVKLKGKALRVMEKLKLSSIDISITHDGGLAVAVALGIPQEFSTESLPERRA